MPINPLCSETHLTHRCCEISNNSPRMWFVDIFQIVLHFQPFKYGSKVMLFYLKKSITFMHLSAWCRLTLEQFVGTCIQLIKKWLPYNPTVYHHFYRSLYTEPVNTFTVSFLRYSLILSFYLCIYFPSGFFPRSFQTVLYMHFLFPPYMMLALLIWASFI